MGCRKSIVGAGAMYRLAAMTWCRRSCDQGKPSWKGLQALPTCRQQAPGIAGKACCGIIKNVCWMSRRVASVEDEMHTGDVFHPSSLVLTVSPTVRSSSRFAAARMDTGFAGPVNFRVGVRGRDGLPRLSPASSRRAARKQRWGRGAARAKRLTKCRITARRARLRDLTGTRTAADPHQYGWLRTLTPTPLVPRYGTTVRWSDSGS